MKHLIFIFSFLFLFSSTSFAQKLSFGVEAGLISSQPYNSFFSSLKSRRNSFNIGLNLNYQISESISLTTGLHYLRQGYKRKIWFGLDPVEEVKVVDKFDNLAVPLAVNFHLLKSKRLMVQLGINVVYNFNTKLDNIEFSAYQNDISSNLRNFNLQTTFGIGYKIIKNEDSDLSIMLKSSPGISNITSTGSFFSRYAPKNHSFSANLIYNFKLKKSKK